ncbi:MAG: roadblock/LC7 domain-containing protein [Xanthomonadales bacterium]|jgi:predicted regulator of Ras-like GTPase activity (Roadblock/LC7/MglB family)|nr:roadblock/LC7 domain-containing protein [Xanthomonadales bacterium]
MDTNQISDSLQLRLEMDLKKLLAVNDQVRAVLLATTDGFEVAYCGDLGSSTPSNISAMTSSMLSLAIAMVNETGLSSCLNLMVEGGQGRAIIMSVPSKNKPMLLTVLTREQVSLGQLLLDAKITVKQLSDKLENC